MKNLSSLLERLSGALNKKELSKEAVIEVIKDKSGVLLAPEKIFIKDSILEIEAPQAAKSEIMLKSGLILSELKERKNLHFSRILYK